MRDYVACEVDIWHTMQVRFTFIKLIIFANEQKSEKRGNKEEKIDEKIEFKLDKRYFMECLEEYSFTIWLRSFFNNHIN